jgi:hypothetical protein
MMDVNTGKTSSAESSIEDDEKIKILLTEYSVLRAETNSRIGYEYQIGGASAVAIAWLLQQLSTGNYGWTFWWLGLLIIIGGFFWFSLANYAHVSRCALRLSEIERDINRRAGEHLMVWQELWGGTLGSLLGGLFASRAIAWGVQWSPWKDRRKPRPRSELPPLDPS